jgi:hypothetical protein
LYAEPVSDFLEAARQLRHIVDAHQIDLTDASLTPEFLVDLWRRNQARNVLELWLNQCAPRVASDARHLSQPELAAPSLLALFALVVHEDLMSGRYPRKCWNDTCRRIFVPESCTTQRYCRVRCKYVALKRLQREKDKAFTVAAEARKMNHRVLH